jgi:hypothetical protein
MARAMCFGRTFIDNFHVACVAHAWWRGGRGAGAGGSLWAENQKCCEHSFVSGVWECEVQQWLNNGRFDARLRHALLQQDVLVFTGRTFLSV